MLEKFVSFDNWYSLLIPALWLVWGAYWLIASRNVKSTARHESRVSKAAHILPLVGAAILLSWPDTPGNVLYRSLWQRIPLTYWVGVAILVAGLAFTIWARLTLGRNWSGTVTIKTGHELIQTGPYRLVRHPIYTGILAGFIGTAISLAELRGVIAVLLVLAAFVIKIRLEERWMTEIFGPTYAAYQKRVSGLIPFIW